MIDKKRGRFGFLQRVRGGKMEQYNSHPIDMLLYREEYGSEEMCVIFSEKNIIKKWLMVDAAIARVEAELGIIPLAAAEEIERKALGDFVKVNRVAELARKKGLDIAAELTALAEVCEQGAGEYIRMGVGGIDNYDTAWALLIKEALELVYRDLSRLVKVLVDLTKKHRHTLMVGRTFGQHEGPITFGFKTAMWAKELYECRRVLVEGEKYYLVGKASGTIGNLSSLEKIWPGKGETFEKIVCEKLGLRAPDMTILFSRRRFMQLVMNLTYIANAIDNIATEIFNRQRPEIDELQEPFRKDQVASTVSPHKRNPYGCNILSGLAELVRSNASAILRSTWFDERDHRRMPIEASVIPTTFIYISNMLQRAIFICENLSVNPSRMLENLNLLKGLNYSEAIGTALATGGLGRYTAYELLREIVNVVYRDGKEFRAVLKSNETVRKYLSEDDIDELTNPKSNLGIVEAKINETLLEIEAIGGMKQASG
jgi:adenylosuccinate lyase